MFKKGLILLLISFMVFGCAKKESKEPEAKVEVEFYNAPLPSFASLFGRFDYVGTTDFDKALQDELLTVEQDVYKSAFALGVLSADGIIAVKSKNKSKLMEISQVMIKYSKIIGINEEILKLADELQNLITNEQWDMLEETLEKYKGRVETSLYESKEYDLFTMLQLGGWMEGLNKISFLLNQNFRTEYSGLINERGILNQLIANYQNLKNPEAKKASYFALTTADLTKIKEILYSNNDDIYTEEQVAEVMKITTGIKSYYK